MKAKWVLFTVLSLLITHQSFAKKCEQNYVPPTNVDQLIEIRHWATVLAFIPMAEKAGFHFDAELYMEEHPNPNKAAFHFGFVTGTNCYSVDVITSYYSYSTVLAKLYGTDVELFKAFYIEHAERYGYTAYLTPLDSVILELATN